MKRRLGMMLMAALMMAAMLITASSAQAQQEFNVFCQTLNPPGSCLGSGGKFFGEEFTCDPLVAPEGTSSQCTREATGETFECVIELGQAVAARHLCTIPAQAPPGGGGGGGAAAPFEISQETEQEAESGDIDQSFEVSSTGDNANQCAAPQGVSNTGNSQNVTDLLHATSEADDFEFEEVGSDIAVSPESSTTCDQQVNQAASASG